MKSKCHTHLPKVSTDNIFLYILPYVFLCAYKEIYTHTYTHRHIIYNSSACFFHLKYLGHLPYNFLLYASSELQTAAETSIPSCGCTTHYLNNPICKLYGRCHKLLVNSRFFLIKRILILFKTTISASKTKTTKTPHVGRCDM